MKKIYSILTVFCLVLLSVSCNNDMEGDQDENMGYLKLDITTLVSTYTRAMEVPQDYNPKTIAVKIKNSAGEVVKESQDATNDQDFKKTIKLEPGKYTITASSAGWDGSDSGFDVPYYTGSTEVEIKSKNLTPATLTLTQANVKVTVNFSDDFRTFFKDVECRVTSELTDVAKQYFDIDTKKSAYFPVAPLSFKLSVTSKESNNDHSNTWDITDVKARDHFDVTFKIAEEGTVGGVKVYVDDATQSWKIDVEVPRKSSTQLEVNAAKPFATYAYLSGAVAAMDSNFDESKLKLQWKKSSDSDESWTSIPASTLTKVEVEGKEIAYKYKLTDLNPNTEYEYRLYYDDTSNATSKVETFTTFATEPQEQIYNSGFENWYMDGKIAICGKEGDDKYWNSSNKGAANYIGSVTTQDTSFKHGGSSSAKLASAWASIKLAAASLFTGDFIGLIGIKGAKLDWGVPFTSRPSALKGYYSYTPGSINRGTQPSGVGAPASGSNDECQIQCALVTEQFHVANANADGYELTTSINWETDQRVIAYGQITKNTSSNGAWEELYIPLVYHTWTTLPTHMIIVCSSSKWGDYFYGSDSSVLYLDDFSFEYGEPTLK